jgi:hypothetical protein
MTTKTTTLPKNLPNIKKHFERELIKNQKRLNHLNKNRRELEIEIETLKEGIEWCQNVYKVSTINGEEK